MSKTNYKLEKVMWKDIEDCSLRISNRIKKDHLKVDVLVPILRGGMPLALLLSSLINVRETACLHITRSLSDETNSDFGEPLEKGLTNPNIIKDANVLIIDDTLDTNKTMEFATSIIKKYNPKSINYAVLYNFNKDSFKRVYSGVEMNEPKWIVFPWDINKT